MLNRPREGHGALASPSPLLSVIIVNWNGAQYLPRCFQSLREQTLRDFEVVLADNGSSDQSVSSTKRDFPEVTCIEFGRNLGYAEANNRAAALSRAEYLFFLNNDTHLAPDALATLVSAAEAHPHVHILSPQQKSYDGAQVLNTGMAVDILGFPCDGHPCPRNVFYADGACLFIRRAVFEELGGFDEQHFMFFEDADLCWRAWLWGYRVGIVPRAVVFHKGGGTTGSSLPANGRYATSTSRRRLTHRNQLAMILKNYSTPALLAIVPLFAALTAAEVLVLVATGQTPAVKEAYIPAWRDLLRDYAHIRAMRRTIQAARVVADWTILRRMEWKLATVQRFLHVGMPTIS